MLASEVQNQGDIVDLLLLSIQNINRCPFAAISNIHCIPIGMHSHGSAGE